MRLTAPDGGPLPELTDVDGAGAFCRLAAGDARRRSPVADLRRDLEAATKAHPKDAQAWSDLGQYSVARGAGRSGEAARGRGVRAARRKLAPSPEIYRQLALAENDANDKRRALEDGPAPPVTARPARAELAPLYEMLGEIYHRARRERRAEELWLDGRAADPAYWPITLDLAELAAERGVPSRAAAMLAALEKRARDAQGAARRGDAGGAARAARGGAEAVRARRRRREGRHRRAARAVLVRARARARRAEALAFVDRIARARPDVLQTALDRADVLEAIGKGGEAHEALKVALTVAPEEARILERDGRLLASARARRRGAAGAASGRSSSSRRIRSCARICSRCEPKERARRSGARVGGGRAVS